MKLTKKLKRQERQHEKKPLTLRQFRSVLANHGRFNEPSWNVWWSILLGAFGEKLTAEESKLFEQFTGRPFTLGAAYRLIAAFVGRRGGKDNAAAIIVVFLAICREWKLAPGETAVVLLLAVDRAQAGVAFDYIKGLLNSVPAFAASITAVTKDRITLTNGVEIQVGTSDQASVRGRTVVAAVMDEFAFWMEGDAVEVPRALRPAMITQPDAKLIVISSIYAGYGPAYELFRQWGEDDKRQLIVKGTTRDFNPIVSQEDIDEELRKDPLGAAAEYLTIPRTDVARFIDEALLDKLTRSSPRELPHLSLNPQGGSYSYFAGIDVSGGRSDSTAAAIARVDQNRVTICAVRHWVAPHDPLVVANEIAEFLKQYGLSCGVADQYGAEVVRSVYREAGVELIASELSRSDTYVAVMPLLTTERIEFPDEPTLRRELIALQRTPGRGKEIVNHPKHGHDDVANACALAAYTASKSFEAGGSAEPFVVRAEFFDDYHNGSGPLGPYIN